MRKVLAAVAAVSFLAAPLMMASAMASTVNAFFDNTVETTTNGATTRWHFDADGKATAKFADGATAVGGWVVKNNQFCITVGDNPETCAPVTEGKGVGDTWSTTNSAGQSVLVTIKAGR
jgi:hypothetical protein